MDLVACSGSRDEPPPPPTPLPSSPHSLSPRGPAQLRIPDPAPSKPRALALWLRPPVGCWTKVPGGRGSGRPPLEWGDLSCLLWEGEEGSCGSAVGRALGTLRLCRPPQPRFHFQAGSGRSDRCFQRMNN